MEKHEVEPELSRLILRCQLHPAIYHGDSVADDRQERDDTGRIVQTMPTSSVDFLYFSNLPATTLPSFPLFFTLA